MFRRIFLKPLNYSKTFESSVDKTINILLYTPLWFDQFWLRGNESGVQNSPELKSCLNKNCRVTTNRSFVGDIADFDALMFFHAHGWIVDEVFMKTPERRKSNQFYIFAADE